MLIPDTPGGGRRGTLFTVGGLPASGEKSSFWIQQYPSYGTPYGRITVDIARTVGSQPKIIGVVSLFVTWV